MQLNKSILYMYIFEYSFLSFQAATGVRGVTARTLRQQLRSLVTGASGSASAIVSAAYSFIFVEASVVPLP